MAIKTNSSDNRKRAWSFFVYPDSAPENWEQRLDGLNWVKSPLHDKDVNPDGSIKKPHWHILIVFEGKKSFQQVKLITDELNSPHPQYVESVKGLVRYMAHLDNPEKATYNKYDIVSHGIEIDSYINSSADVDALMREIEVYCRDNQIYEYGDLVLLSWEFPGWHKCVTGHTIHFRAFLGSLRHSKKTDWKQYFRDNPDSLKTLPEEVDL